MNDDNKGFTLVELVICMVIFAIVVSAAFGFMISGSRTYNSVTDRLNLQLESQLAMNQLGDYIMDCNAGLYFEADTLYIINKGSSTTAFDVHVFQRKPDGCIYYGFGEDAATLASGKFTITPPVKVDDLLTENVTDFSVALISSPGTKVTSAEVAVEFTKNSVKCLDKKIIALRNKPSTATLS